MTKLILIKHSLPAIDPTRPAATWQLAPEGQQRCARLAEQLTAYLPAVLVSSPEPKAYATAAYLADHWGVLFAPVPGLEEQHRQTAPFLSDSAFQDAIRQLFAQPTVQVYGEETADAATARFTVTLEQLIAQHHPRTLIAVTHGTVISLYVSRRTGQDPFDLWFQLGLPAYIVFDHTAQAIELLVSQV